MPLFGVEREEAPKSKRLPFLSQKSHDPVRASTSASGPFGSEGCESSEPLPHRPSKSIHPRNLPQQSLVLFGSEPDEDEAEPGSSGESNDGFDYEAYRENHKLSSRLGGNRFWIWKKLRFGKILVNPSPRKSGNITMPPALQQLLTLAKILLGNSSRMGLILQDWNVCMEQPLATVSWWNFV